MRVHRPRQQNTKSAHLDPKNHRNKSHFHKTKTNNNNNNNDKNEKLTTKQFDHIQTSALLQTNQIMKAQNIEFHIHKNDED